MTTLKQGDLIKDKNGETSKVIEVLGQIVFISYSDNFNSCWIHQTEEQLKKQGYTWDTPAWQPEIGELYWAIVIGDTGRTARYIWENSSVDRARRDFLGIYKNQKLAEAALLEIRRKLGK